MRLFKIILIGVAFIFLSLADARTINIPDDYPTIQEGINAASDGDSISVESGVYQEHIDYSGKDLTILSVSGPTSTIIEAQSDGESIVKFTSGETNSAALIGFTIRNSINAAGILIRNSSPCIYRNLIVNNQGSGYGGGISIDYSSNTVVKENRIEGNSAIRGGGLDSGIYGAGDVTVENNIFINNNSSTHGGGVFIKNGTSSIVRKNVFYNNYCPTLGGGLCISTSDGVVIQNNDIVENSNSLPDHGGGITIWYSYNCEIYNNIVVHNIGEGILQAHGAGNNADYNDCWDNTIDYVGITPGPGCISADPLFVGGDPFDFHLQPGSPCIDAGDPDSPLDPDGSIADMGAYYFGSVLENGLDIADIYAENGQDVAIPITAGGLAEQEIAGVEFHIEYGQSCLEYTDFISDYLSDPLINVADGIINVLWEDFQNPITVPDSAVIAEIRCTVLGEIGDTCMVEWTGNNELVDPLGDNIPGVEWIDGSVRVIEFHSITGGVIYYDQETAVPGVAMLLSGDYSESDTTDDGGTYGFMNLFPGSFTICPMRTNDDPGVTVTDIVNIRRHIVRLEPFDTPYKLIAADVNLSGNVSVADVIKLRRYLAALDQLPSGNWSFVNSSFTVDDDNWPEAPGCLDFELWDADLADSNFVGIRMGDVDYSWREGRRRAAPPGSHGDVLLEMEDCLGEPGDVVRMRVNAAGLNPAAGMEFHMRYPSQYLRCLGIGSEIMDDPTINFIDGNIHFVWEDIFDPVSILNVSEAAYVTFEVLENAPDSLPISFSSSHISDQNGIDYDVVTKDGYIYQRPASNDGNDPAVPSSYRLGQNYPNPFNARTTIEFDTPETAFISIGIYDMLGREIELLVNRQYSAGYHRITWDASDQPSGIYFVRLQGGQIDTARKMILIK